MTTGLWWARCRDARRLAVTWPGAIAYAGVPSLPEQAGEGKLRLAAGAVLIGRGSGPYRGRARGSPKQGKTLLSENQVMALIWSPRRVSTIIP